MSERSLSGKPPHQEQWYDQPRGQDHRQLGDDHFSMQTPGTGAERDENQRHLPHSSPQDPNLQSLSETPVLQASGLPSDPVHTRRGSTFTSSVLPTGDTNTGATDSIDTTRTHPVHRFSFQSQHKAKSSSALAPTVSTSGTFKPGQSPPPMHRQASLSQGSSLYASNLRPITSLPDRGESIRNFGLPRPAHRDEGRKNRNRTPGLLPVLSMAVMGLSSDTHGSPRAGEEGGAEEQPEAVGSLTRMVTQKFSKGTEDGDKSDFARFWSALAGFSKQMCACCGWGAKKVFTEGIKQFGERPYWEEEKEWAESPEEGETPDDDMDVEDVRAQYVLGTLSSTHLEGLEGVDRPGGKVGNEAAVIRKEDFLMKLAVSLLSYGCPIPRIEYSMQVLLQTMGMEGSFIILPNIMFISFGSPSASNTETHILPVGGGLDVYKLRRVNHLVNLILEQRIPSLPFAIKKLDSMIAEPPLYSWQVKLACYTIASGCVAPLFFSGSLIDGLLAGFVGIFAGGLWVMADVSYIVGKLGVFASAWLASFLATILAAHIPNTCSLAIHFGPIVYLLPGWSITSSIIELSTQSMISGTVRMMTALMNALLIGFGLDLGHRMTFWESNVSWTSTENCNPVSMWTQIPLFIATVTCFNILMKAAPVQWLSMLIVAAIGYVTINLAPTVGKMTPGSSTVLTAFVCGVAGNLYAYATNSPALVPILAGVFLIVPGGMSVRGVEKWLNDDLNGGLDFGSGMMLVAVSISIGLFASSVIMYRPKLKISNAVFF